MRSIDDPSVELTKRLAVMDPSTIRMVNIVRSIRKNDDNCFRMEELLSGWEELGLLSGWD